MINFSTLISPLLTLASAMNPSNLNRGQLSASALAALDRSLGTIASLGLTLGLYRVLVKLRDEYAETAGTGHNYASAAHSDSNMSSITDQGGNIIVSMRSLVHVFIRNILMGMGIKRVKKERMQEENSTMDGINGGNQNHAAKQWRHENPVWTYHGSCHCKSISFVLRAPSHIEAKDNKGKIKYPHFISDAHDFQLTNGNEFLSVYYVDLATTSANKPDYMRNPYYSRYEPKQSQIAAHTFCSRCGVHILRAPNSHTDKLEVNINCLDEFNSKNPHSEEFVSINVTVDESKDGMGLGEGRPVFLDHHRKQQSQQQQTRSRRNYRSFDSRQGIESRQGSYDDYQSVSSLNTYNNSYSVNSSTMDTTGYSQQQHQQQHHHRTEMQQPWHEDSAYKQNEYERNPIKWKQIDAMSQASTPATLTSTLVTNSGEESDVSSTVGGLSCDENDLSPNPYAAQRRSGDVSISGWPTASSIQSNMTPRNKVHMTESSTTGRSSPFSLDTSSVKTRSSSTMKDQMKYYMRKHMTPPSRETGRRKSKKI